MTVAGDDVVIADSVVVIGDNVVVGSGGGAVGKITIGIDMLVGSVTMKSSSLMNCTIGACNEAAY